MYVCTYCLYTTATKDIYIFSDMKELESIDIFSGDTNPVIISREKSKMMYSVR